jgi:hypothetical protein
MPVSPTARRALFTIPVLAIVVAAGTVPALAQAPAPPDSAKMKTEIAKLGWMIGTWEGDAWIQRGPEKIELRQKETVALRLDGLALLVDGEGRPKSDPSTVQYRALGVLYWDAYANGLKLNSWTGEGYRTRRSCPTGSAGSSRRRTGSSATRRRTSAEPGTKSGSGRPTARPGRSSWR